MTEASVIALIQLILTPHIGNVTIKAALMQELSLAELYTLNAKSIKSLGIFNERQIKQLVEKNFDLLKLEKVLAYIEQNKIQIVPFTDPKYPIALKQCDDAPAYLFYKGNAPLQYPKSLAIVGTRHHTTYGRTVLQQLLNDLKNLDDLVIISGLAQGIDGIAHQTAVNLKIPTIGVMGHGHDMIYPEIHQKLAIDMQQNGGLLTEFLPFTIPEKGNFPLRNRIIAGMSDMTLVIESAKKGGSMITAHLANDYNKTVGAIPGEIYKTASQGCNDLIRKNVAHMITSAQDIKELMNWDKSPKIKQAQLFLTLNEEEQNVVNIILQHQPIYIDQLKALSNYSSSALSKILLNLELQDVIISNPGKTFSIAK